MQTPSGRTPIGELWNSIQSWLFPVLEDEIGALDEKHRQFVAVCELYELPAQRAVSAVFSLLVKEVFLPPLYPRGARDHARLGSTGEPGGAQD